MAEPTVVYEVAVYGDHGDPAYRALFFDRALAEAYQAALPDSEIEEVPVETELPAPVTVHHREQYIVTRDGASYLGLETVPPHEIGTWTHMLRDNRAHWSSTDHDVTVRATTEPDLKLVQVTALDEGIARRVLAETEQRLKAEAAVRAVAGRGLDG